MISCLLTFLFSGLLLPCLSVLWLPRCNVCLLVCLLALLACLQVCLPAIFARCYGCVFASFIRIVHFDRKEGGSVGSRSRNKRKWSAVRDVNAHKPQSREQHCYPTKTPSSIDYRAHKTCLSCSHPAPGPPRSINSATADHCCWRG